MAIRMTTTIVPTSGVGVVQFAYRPTHWASSEARSSIFRGLENYTDGTNKITNLTFSLWGLCAPPSACMFSLNILAEFPETVY